MSEHDEGGGNWVWPFVLGVVVGILLMLGVSGVLVTTQLQRERARAVDAEMRARQEAERAAEEAARARDMELLAREEAVQARRAAEEALARAKRGAAETKKPGKKD
jgi:flagellar biosynthesis/type III secretory pathway M-ring protein FliF/YscJ